MKTSIEASISLTINELKALDAILKDHGENDLGEHGLSGSEIRTIGIFHDEICALIRRIEN